MLKIERIQRPIHTGEVTPEGPSQKSAKVDQESFADLLRTQLPNKTQSVRFSAHAAERLLSRNIILTEKDMARLSDGVQKMEQKGAKESLMVMGDLAFVVSVKNRTVITAMDRAPSANDKIFTNIDSALIMH